MLHAAVNALPDFIYIFDLEGRFLYTNPALSNLLQRSPAAMVGLDFHDLGYPNDLATILQAQIQEVIQTKDILRAETLFEAATGPGYYEYIFAPILNERDEVTSVAGTTRDITERRRTENALRESQKAAIRPTISMLNLETVIGSAAPKRRAGTGFTGLRGSK